MITQQTYTQASTAWEDSVWKPLEGGVTEELNLSISTDEGWHGDFSIQWGTYGPRIKCFSDSWRALEYLAPVFAEFNEEKLTPEDLISALEQKGFEPSEYHGQRLETSEKSVSLLRREALNGKESAIHELARRAQKED